MDTPPAQSRPPSPAPPSDANPFMDRLVRIGAGAMLVMGATQWSLQVRPKTYLSPVDPLVWLVFGIWFARTWFTDRRLLRIPLFAALFLAACAASLVHATDRVVAIKDIVQFTEYFGAAFLVLAAALRLPRGHDLCGTTFLAVASAVVGVALMQYVRLDGDAFAIGGCFTNRNVLGGFLALAAPFAISILLHTRRPWIAAWMALLLAGTACVVLSGGTVLAIAVAALALAARRGRLVLLATAAALVLWVGILQPRLPRDNREIAYRSIAAFDAMGEILPRYPEWQAAAIMTLENPWFGVGIGNYQTQIGAYYGMLPNPNIAAEPDSQNLFLVLSASIGLPGLVCFMAMLLAGVAAASAPRHEGMYPGMTQGAAAGLIGFMIAAVWSPLLVRGLGIPLVFLLAVAYRTDATRSSPAE
jgi:O-antigen ligase